MKEADLFRDPADWTAREAAERAAQHAGARFLDCSSNDYLGFGRTGVSRETTMEIEGMPLGAGASRLIQGTRAPHLELESALADWVRKPAALLFTSGYAANVGLISALGSRGGLIVSDALNHASIIDGCRLSRAEVRVVPHLDVAAVDRALAEAAQLQPRWVVTESYFSMDGDVAALTELRQVCDRHGAGLIVDEAHALGVFGPEGAGRLAEASVEADAVVGTLGKAVGAQGAFIAGSESLRGLLWNRARSAVFSTAPSPVLSHLTLLHVKRARQADSLRTALAERADLLRSLLRRAGLKVVPGSTGPIVPVVLGSNRAALAAAQALRAGGVLAQAIRPPTVPEGTARIRLTVQATFTENDVRRIAGLVERSCAGS